MINQFSRLSMQRIALKSIVKPLLLGAVLTTTISISTEKALAESELTTVYHIYINDEYIGTVNNQDDVKELTNKKIAEQEELYSHLNLTAEEIEMIPEQMFRPIYNNEDTIAKLEKELEVVVESTELKINNEVIAYFNSKLDAEEALNAYKLQFVSEDVLNRLEINEKANLPEVPLEIGESRILDVAFTEKISLETKKVSPEKIITIDQGINLLKKGTLVDSQYEVKEEDVLGTIAQDHQLSLEQLLQLNPGLEDDSLIKPGDTLHVTVPTPFVKVSEKVETLKKEEIPFETEVISDSTLPKGEQKVMQAGQAGEKVINYMIYQENDIEVKKEKLSEQSLKEPVKEIIVKGTKIIPSRGTGDLSWPANGGYISSKLGQRWGKLHKGIDIARPSDLTIKAADNGEIISAGYQNGYGNKVVIDHNNGLQTVYAHLDSISVSVGQIVSQGQKLGIMGNTGNSTGIHLHFEVYENGKLKNPLDYLN